MNPLPLLASDNTSSADHIMTINDVMVFTKALKLRSLLFGSHFISHPGNIFVWTANTSGIISLGCFLAQMSLSLRITRNSAKYVQNLLNGPVMGVFVSKTGLKDGS